MPVILPGQPPPRKKKQKSAGGFFQNLLGDIPELARSVVVDLPVAIGTGIGHTGADLWRFYSPTEKGFDWGQLEKIGSRVGAIPHSITRGIQSFLPTLPYENKAIIGKDEEGNWRFWFDYSDPEDTKSALDAWYNDPLVGALNFLPAAGVASRVGSIRSLSSSIRTANPGLSAGNAIKLASAETRYPGVLSTYGIKGGLPERTLRIDLGAQRKVPAGELEIETAGLEELAPRAEGWGVLHGLEPTSITEAVALPERLIPQFRDVTLPRSGSPIGRALESAYDAASRQLPGRFSEQARAGRFEARQQRERLRGIEAEVKGLSEPILELAYGYGKGPKSNLWNFLRGELERNPTATALSALVQLPREMSPTEALTAYLKSRGAILAEGSYTRPVYTALEDAPNPEKFVGGKVAYVSPNERPVWTLESVNEKSATLTRGNATVIADHADVFPLKPTGQGRYGPAFSEAVPLDAESIGLIRSEMAEIKQVLNHPPSPEKFASAIKAMERISELVEQYGFWLNARGLTAAERKKLAARYERRRDLIVNDLVARGLIPEGMTARGYFPHFSLWRALTANWTGPVRLPGSGRVVGRTQMAAEVGRNSPNNLILHQLGQVLMDPSALMYLLTKRLRVAETFAMRKDYWDIALPLKDAPKGKGGYLIRDPDRAAKAISDRTRAQLNLSEDEWAKLVRSGEDTASVLDDADANAAEIGDFLASRERALPEWGNEDGVRWLPEHVVEARFGSRVFRGETPASLGLANALARVALILGRPLRYAMSNIPSNTLMLAATNPEALLEAAKLMANRGRIRGVSAPLMQQIRAEAGEVKARAGIPTFGTARVRAMEKGEEWVSRQSSRMADAMGTVVDEPFRIAAWMARAKKMGFVDADDWARLLKAPDDSPLGRARQQIRQRTRDDLLDFDSLTQWEREKGTRYLFVWPYLRAAMKWPFVYARERPVAAGLISAAAQAAPNVPIPHPLAGAGSSTEVRTPWGVIDFAQANPLSPTAEFSGSISSLAHGDMAEAFGYLSPTFRELLRAQERSPGEILKGAASQFVPFGPLQKNILEDGLRHALLEEMIRYAPQTPFASVSRNKREEMAKIRRVYGQAILDDPDVKRGLDAFWEFKDVEARSKLGVRERTGRKKLSATERQLLLRMIWQRYYPDDPFPDLEPREETNDAIADALFRYRNFLAHGLPTEEELERVGYVAPP